MQVHVAILENQCHGIFANEQDCYVKLCEVLNENGKRKQHSSRTVEECKQLLEEYSQEKEITYACLSWKDESVDFKNYLEGEFVVVVFTWNHISFKSDLIPYELATIKRLSLKEADTQIDEIISSFSKLEEDVRILAFHITFFPDLSRGNSLQQIIELQKNEPLKKKLKTKSSFNDLLSNNNLLEVTLACNNCKDKMPVYNSFKACANDNCKNQNYRNCHKCKRVDTSLCEICIDWIEAQNYQKVRIFWDYKESARYEEVFATMNIEKWTFDPDYWVEWDNCSDAIKVVANLLSSLDKYDWNDLKSLSFSEEERKINFHFG